MITFWATWCGPCRAELPVKKAFHSQYGDQVHFVAVNMTNSEASVAEVERYVIEEDLAYPIALDASGRLARAFGVRGTPTTIVIDGEGHVVARWMGASSIDRLRRAIR